VEKQAKRLDQALGTSIVFFSLFFFLDKKERKNQDAKKLPPANPNAGPLLRRPTRPQNND